MPYRSKPTQPTPTISRSPRGDRDLLPIWALLWLAAASRVAVAMVHHEIFRAEATLALIVVALIPGLVLSPCIRNWWQSRALGARRRS